MRLAPWRTLRGRLVAAALLVELVMLAILVGNSQRLLRNAMGEQARDQAEQIAPVLTAALVAPLAQSDYATVQAVLQESHAIRGIDYLAVTDASGAIVAISGWPANMPLPTVDAAFNLDDDDDPPRYDLALPIKLSAQRLGTLQMGLALGHIVVARKNLLTQGMLIAGGELLLSVGLLSFLGYLITRQLTRLTKASLAVAEGRPVLKAAPEGPDDVGRLGAAFNAMQRAIAERVQQLTQARDENARIAESLRESTAQLNAIFELSPDGFVSFDAKGHITYASPAFFRMLGWAPGQVIGLDEPAFSARLANACTETAQFPGVAGLPQAAEAAGRKRQLIELAGSSKRVLEVGLRRSDAEAVSQILFFRDVTHETEVDRMKSEFLSHAAHELRTPMASIAGFAELLATRKFTDERRQDVVGIIRRQSSVMVSIINELLDLVRIDDRRGQDFEFTQLDLRALVQEVLTDFGVPDGREPATLHGPPTALPVRADPQKLAQAVRNIVSNAYKYSPGGGPVTITLQREGDGAEARAALQVTDCGIGMTPEQAARVCERFYRADASGNIPGTGLGMAIVKEIVTLHGGEMGIASTAGVGTSVSLWLPSPEAPAAARASTDDGHATAEPLATMSVSLS